MPEESTQTVIRQFEDRKETFDAERVEVISGVEFVSDHDEARAAGG